MKPRVSDPTKTEPAAPGPESGNDATPIAPEGAGDLLLDRLAESRGEFSSDDIDEFLKVQDPAFAGQLQGIQGDTTLSADESEIDADTAALHDEIERWRSARGIRRSLYMVMPFLPRLSLFFTKCGLRLLVLWRTLRMNVQNFAYYLATKGRKSAQAWIKAKIQGVTGGIGKFFADLKLLSLKLKLALLGLILLVAAGVGVLYLAWQGKLLPKEKPLFVTDLADYATQVYEVDEEEGFENFYDNVRSTPNMLLIQRLIINIKKSENSGPNPMAAGEFFVEGLNPDVVIEVKDREAFFRDLIQRSMEEFDFDELGTAEGKKRLTQVLLKEINHHLTTGSLRNIRIKTLILKP